jgi:hypothetical protein
MRHALTSKKTAILFPKNTSISNQRPKLSCGFDSVLGVFDVVIPNSELREALQQPSLWNLNQQRNLIVHRGGIVDHNYLKNTGEKVEVGTPLRVRPAALKSGLRLVRDVGTKLLEGAYR